MKILVSACLIGTNCKYNGGNNYSEKICKFLEGHEVIPVCPEVLGGLPVPRAPAEIVGGTVTDTEGKIVDGEFRLGAQKALELALKNKVDLAILQARSPSCGSKQVYDGTFSKKLVEGSGVFASLLLQHGIKVLDSSEF